jgi:disulfide bond formation protein DsbB
MSEAGLETLLEHGVRRLRMQRALRAGLLALGVGLLAAAALIFAARLAAVSGPVVTTLAALPAVIALAALIAAYARHRPSSRTAALLLDQRAASDEHLVTWFELRAQPDASLNETQREFKAAQREATMRRSAGLNAAKLLPMSLPQWSRALWLALLLLFCAILMPAQSAAPRLAAPIRDDLRPSVRANPGGGSPAGEKPPAGSVQVYSPSELLKMQLMVTNPNLSAEQREQLKTDLLSKIGDTPLSSLSAEVRDLLKMLDIENVRKPEKAGGEQGEQGTAQGNGNAGENDPETKKNLGTGAVVPVSAQAFTVIREQYPDVQPYLERFYAGSRKTEKTGGEQKP